MNSEFDEPDRGRERPIRVTTDELFGSESSVVIRHGNTDYELRITRRKRLILTKKDQKVL